MQHEVNPEFDKLQTCPNFTTSGDIEVQKKVKDEVRDSDIHQQSTLDPGYLEISQTPSNTSITYSGYQKTTASGFIFTNDSANLELRIAHSKPCGGLNHENHMLGYSDNVVSTDRYNKEYGLQNNKNQMKWWRNNITATMEHFEPTQSIRPSTSTSFLDYGTPASVVTSVTKIPNSSQVAHSSTVSSSEIGSINNTYSYAYHEQGSAKYNTNFPHAHRKRVNKKTTPSNQMETCRNEQRNSFQTFLSKDFRAESIRGQPVSLSPFVEDRHTYTTRHGTTENLYEEVHEHKIRKVPSNNRIAVSAADYVKEELRRVQQNHFRVLDELNLSLEALIMPPSPEHLNPSNVHGTNDSTENIASGSISPTKTFVASNTTFPQKPRRCGLLGGDSSSLSSDQNNGFANTSLENLSNFHSMELKHPHHMTSNPEFDEGDLDSGFSGSGSSSGTSYNDSVRNLKSGNPSLLTRNQHFLYSKNTCCSPTSKSSVASQEDYGISSVVCIANVCGEEMSPGRFHDTSCGYVHRSDIHNLSVRSIPTWKSTKSKKYLWTSKP